MKITESLIEKFGLKKTDIYNGLAFVHDLKTFDYPLPRPKIEQAYFMECNANGEPLPGRYSVMIIYFDQGIKHSQYCEITQAFAENCTKDMLDKFLMSDIK